MTLSQSSVEVSWTVPTPAMPALLKSTSMCPSAFAVSSAIRRASSGSVTSAKMALALPPSAWTSLTVSSAPARSTSAMTTHPPSRAKRSALARPMPEPAPVMRQTFPSRRPLIPR